MEKLNAENKDTPLTPATWKQIEEELPDTVNALVMAALGLGPGEVEHLPIWYVLTKASGFSGIPIERLYQNPIERQHALAVMGCDVAARNRVVQRTEEELRERRRTATPHVETN